MPSFSQTSSSINIIPKPVSLKTKPGSFKVDRNTKLVVKDEGDRGTADFFSDYVKKYYGLSLEVAREADKNYISFATKKFIKAPDNEEHYTLNSSTNSVSVEGDSYAGTFRGMQSIIQLLPVKKSSNLGIPLVTIDDQPRLAYRGLMLDVARHFFSVEFVKKYIDFIALHKMNRFHWHLTDDQGWRIEIKKHPKLTEVGGYRNGTIIGRYPGTGNDNIRYGGFYTQDEIKEVVAYAAKRYITVIPEIEMPGHAKAALAAYPFLGCTGGPYEVRQTWAVEDEVFCAGNDSVFALLQDVMDEVLPLFPSEYVHVGGDECPKSRWKTCPKCQKRIKDENLKDEHELQSYFIQRMEKYINSKGKKIIGWDEILEGGLAPNATVMSWRGEQGGIEAAKQDHDVIMTPGSFVYLDHSQSKKEDSVTIGGYLSIQKVYSYDPVPKVLNKEQQKHILGAQGNVWTEYMANPRKVEYMIFPRLTALSEVLWSPSTPRSWDEFEKRLSVQFKRYDLWKVNYSRAMYTDMRIKVDKKKKIASN
ncbi:MAG: beta-N-acetylhexosaminidase [Chitinophagaceae bacterium]|nr:beta-N-acetylhexosaminidase [Chitinophagaceae bacterium]